MPLNWLRCRLTISLTVIMDGIFAAYLFLPSAHLDSHWFCLVNNLTGYPWYFFSFNCPCAYLSVTDHLKNTEWEFYISLDWDRLLLCMVQSPDQGLASKLFWILEVSVEGWWLSLKTLLKAVVFQSPPLRSFLFQAGLSLNSWQAMSPMGSHNPL